MKQAMSTIPGHVARTGDAAFPTDNPPGAVDTIPSGKAMHKHNIKD
jgi:hypothetical protein